ncbi:MAG: hypothetical protein J6P28_10415 [Treponema sp.]|nr:hypothetical protein [Treponema sp.]
MKKLKVLAILLPLLSLLTVLIFIAACSNSSSGGSDEVAVAASEPGCSSDSDCPEGCLAVDEDGNCTKCAAGYILDENRNCVASH